MPLAYCPDLSQHTERLRALYERRAQSKSSPLWGFPGARWPSSRGNTPPAPCTFPRWKNAGDFGMRIGGNRASLLMIAYRRPISRNSTLEEKSGPSGSIIENRALSTAHL